MQLLDDIVAVLGDEGQSLAAALLKAKVLLHKLQRKELSTWLNKEIEVKMTSFLLIE